MSFLIVLDYPKYYNHLFDLELAAYRPVNAKMIDTIKRYDWKKATHCCLCGESFIDNSAEDRQTRSRQHVPSKQFFPKEIRESENLNLWTAASHKGCNGDSKEDEEYFYLVFWVQVANANPAFSQVMQRDIARRAAQPQSRVLIRRILKDAGPVTPGGIVLPRNVIRWGVDPYRTQQVAISMAQALSCYHDYQFLPKESCVDIRLCLGPDDLPEMYQLVMKHTPMASPYPAVFKYWRFQMKRNLKFYALLFWGSFLFCLTFRTDS